jgi:hypothetical protein
MKKKLTATCVALLATAALAVAPGVASAALYSGSTLLPEGSSVKGVSEGSIHFESANSATFNCTSSEWVARLDVNRAGHADLLTQSWSFHGTGTEGLCTSGVGTVAVIGSSSNACWYAKESTWMLVGGQLCEHGTVALTVFWNFGTVCKYKLGISTYSSTKAPIKLTNASPELFLTEGTGSFCASTYKMMGPAWNVKDASGNPVSWK